MPRSRTCAARRPDALHAAAMPRRRAIGWCGLAREWLDLDFNREPFEVIAVEKKHTGHVWRYHAEEA